MKVMLDKLYAIMGTMNLDLSPTEAAIWQAMPFIIPAILVAILFAFITGKIGIGGREEE